MTTRLHRTTAATFVSRLWSLGPSGGSLAEGGWRARHRFLVGLTFFHVVIIALIGPVLGRHWELSFRSLLDDESALHIMSESLVVALFGILACWRRVGRTIQATFVGFGLMSASAILVHLSGGYIEFHFHFFVILTFLALCQDWIPYLLAVAFVAGRFNERAFAQTALILQAAGEGIFGVDTEAQITFINPAAATILGADARAAIGNRLG